MTIEMKMKSEMISRAFAHSDIKRLQRCINDPKTGLGLLGTKVSVDVELIEVANIWTWFAKVSVKNRFRTMSKGRYVDYENWQTDIDIVCKELIDSILFAGTTGGRNY